MPANEKDRGEQIPTGWFKNLLRIGFSVVLLVELVVSFFASSYALTTNQLLLATILLVALFFEDARELAIGPLLTMKRGIEEVKREQANISNNLQAIFSQQVRQTQQTFLQVHPPMSEAQQKEFNETLAETENLKAELSTVKQEAETSQRTANERLLEALRFNDRLLEMMERWEFRYLDLYLPVNAKRLLYRLVQRGRQRLTEFSVSAYLLGQLDLPAIIDPLLIHGLIKIDTDGTVTPTDRAERFLKVTGFEDRAHSKAIESLLKRSAKESPPPPPPPAQE